MRKNRVIFLGALVLCLLCVWIALPAGATAPSYNGYERSVMALVNQERMAAGLHPLSMFASLQSAASVRAEELHTLYDHTRPDGTSCFSVLSQFGVNWSSVGENIARGYPGSSEVMEAWMNSPGHRSNILTNGFTHGGMGYDKVGQYETRWCQLFVGQDCTYSNLRFSLPAGGVVVPAGTPVADMGVVAIMDCSVHGESHFPLVNAMAHPKTAQPGTSEITVSLFGQSASFPVSIAKDTYDLSQASWAYSPPLVFDGTEKTITLTGLPEGLIPIYSGNTATLPGTYIASVTFEYDAVNFEKPVMPDLSWEICRKEYDLSGTKWIYPGPFDADGSEKTVVLSGLPEGLTPIYSGNTATLPGSYTASVTFDVDETCYVMPVVPDLQWEIIGNAPPTGGALPGDANGDKAVDILDLVSIIDHIVSGTPCVSMDNADANGDEIVDILDLVWIIDRIVAR